MLYRVESQATQCYAEVQIMLQQWPRGDDEALEDSLAKFKSDIDKHVPSAKNSVTSLVMAWSTFADTNKEDAINTLRRSRMPSRI